MVRPAPVAGSCQTATADPKLSLAAGEDASNRPEPGPPVDVLVPPVERVQLEAFGPVEPFFNS